MVVVLAVATNVSSSIIRRDRRMHAHRAIDARVIRTLTRTKHGARSCRGFETNNDPARSVWHGSGAGDNNDDDGDGDDDGEYDYVPR